MASPGDVVVDPITGRILETPALRALGLSQLRALLASTPLNGLVLPRTDDRFLAAFLRARKYNVARAHELVLNFARFWARKRDVIEGLCAADCRRFAELGMMKFLRGKDVHGNTVVALFMGALDVTKFSPRDQVAFSIYTLAHLFEDDELQLQGALYVETMEGFSLGGAMALSGKMSSADQKEMMSLATQTFPMRIRGILLIEQVSWAARGAPVRGAQRRKDPAPFVHTQHSPLHATRPSPGTFPCSGPSYGPFSPRSCRAACGCWARTALRCTQSSLQPSCHQSLVAPRRTALAGSLMRWRRLRRAQA